MNPRTLDTATRPQAEPHGWLGTETLKTHVGRFHIQEWLSRGRHRGGASATCRCSTARPLSSATTKMLKESIRRLGPDYLNVSDRPARSTLELIIQSSAPAKSQALAMFTWSVA